MTTRQQTRSTLPTGVLAAIFVCIVGAAIAAAYTNWDSDSSKEPSSNTSSALSPSFVPETRMTEAEQLNAEMKQHEDLTTNEFGPMVVPPKTLDEQIAEALAEHENGLAAQLGR